MIFKDTRVNSLSELVNVIKQGTHRVTLKNHEATVSKGFMAEAIKYAHEHDVSVNVVINIPTETSYQYSDIEIKALEADIFEAQALGADSIEFLALNEDGSFDVETADQFLAACGGMEGTISLSDIQFTDDQLEKIAEWVEEKQISRVYTDNAGTDELIKLKEVLPNVVPATTSLESAEKLEFKQIQL